MVDLPSDSTEKEVKKRMAFENMNIKEKVKGIVVEQLGVSPEEVSLEATFVEDLGADSLDVVELVMAIEEEFGIEIPDEDAEKIQKVGDCIEYITKHLKTKETKEA